METGRRFGSVTVRRRSPEAKLGVAVPWVLGLCTKQSRPYSGCCAPSFDFALCYWSSSLPSSASPLSWEAPALREAAAAPDRYTADYSLTKVLAEASAAAHTP